MLRKAVNHDHSIIKSSNPTPAKEEPIVTLKDVKPVTSFENKIEREVKTAEPKVTVNTNSVPQLS